MTSATPQYRIRPARPEDAAALAAIEAAAFDAARYDGLLMTRRSFRQHAAGRNALLVAEADGEVRGYALGFVKSGSPYVRFYSLAILPQEAGKGAGRLLFEAIEDFARARGCRGVRLEIRADNRRLLDRYLALGYRIFAEVPNYYPDGCGAIRMVRDLPPVP
jgi:ribosomal protein S18 acetylase RimI-like enzyme